MHTWHYAQKKTRFNLLSWAWHHKWLVLLFASGCYLFGGGLYIFAKANIAQYLIAQAWQLTLQDQQQHRPWPWADTHPVAELKINGISWFVLADANGRNLAFAPTHLSATALPGNPGNSVIVGHRDTQFNSLKHLQVGDIIEVNNTQRSLRYRVSALRIAEASQLRYWQTDTAEAFDQASLTLVTCYPFDSILPNPTYRFIVSAEGV
jgi:sortase A